MEGKYGKYFGHIRIHFLIAKQFGLGFTIRRWGGAIELFCFTIVLGWEKDYV